jgi:hypothetical protein
VTDAAIQQPVRVLAVGIAFKRDGGHGDRPTLPQAAFPDRLKHARHPRNRPVDGSNTQIQAPKR